jgi:hypothetical protein
VIKPVHSLLLRMKIDSIFGYEDSVRVTYVRTYVTHIPHRAQETVHHTSAKATRRKLRLDTQNRESQESNS